jgi:ketosteroid isomerase-like protein
MSEETVQSMRGVRYRVSLPDERAGQRRSLDERLFVPFPVLYRLLASRLMRLPLRSRLRGWWLRRLAQRALAAANRRDFAVLLLGLDPGVEYHPAADQVLDQPGVSHGHDGYEKAWREIMDAFEDFRGEPRELIDLGDMLLATIQYSGHGSGSGVPVELPLFPLFRLRRGLVVWQQDFSNRSDALEAAGLSVEAMSQENVEHGARIRTTGLNTTRKRRTLDERIFVRFPALFRRFASFWSRLPLRSRLRRLILLRLVAQGTSAANRRDFDVLLLGFDPEVDLWIARGGMNVPDFAGHHHGHAGYREAWRRLLEAFEDLTWEPEELIDAGDGLISVTRWSGRGTGSGVPVNQLMFQVYTLRRGLVVKQEDFADRGDALEAVGLRA